MRIGKLAWIVVGLCILQLGVASSEADGLQRYVFLVDTSASMIGREDGRTVIFPQVQRELMRFAQQVAEEAEVHLVPFSAEPQEMARFVLPQERESMLRYVRGLRAEGGSSRIFGSLRLVYSELCNEPRAFYLFTDGLDNSAEPAQMPELNSQCPLTLVALGTLPKGFTDAWTGFRHNRLADPPSKPLAHPIGAEVPDFPQTPDGTVSSADPPPLPDPVLAGVQKAYGEKPGPQPAPAPPSASPEVRPSPPPARTAPPQKLANPNRPQTIAPASPRPAPAAPARPSSTPPGAVRPAVPKPTPAPAPTELRTKSQPISPSATPKPTLGVQTRPPKAALYRLYLVGSPRLVDGAVVVVYRLEASPEATLPLKLRLQEAPPGLRISYNHQPQSIAVRPGEQFELRVSNPGTQAVVLETGFRVEQAPGPVELPPVLQLSVPPLGVSRGGPGWGWALAGVLLLAGLGRLGVLWRRSAQAPQTAPVDNRKGLHGSEANLVPLSPPLLSLDFFGAVPEQRRKYLPLLTQVYDLGEAIGDPLLARFQVQPGPTGLEVLHLPGHLRVYLEGQEPLHPGQTVEPGRTLHLFDLCGTAVGILSVQRM
ncbi:vWA domain-containing protein [Meiothermus sp.]|uniref:vWA domain-containing protein n=1 Tax=Meiothermus sp. TaxID=1955249 RepID=UPI0021DD2249|nr:vWA domain-containing protein [Meiothermus sp.]GIW25670.1 MAG: hypothetical protein KatS3mg069_1937 [Meiothermus sp.]